MEPSDLTVKILTEIRDAVRETNTRVDQTNERIDVLADRVVEAEIRSATAILALGSSLDDVKTLLRDRLDLRDRVDRCEVDIRDLKDRMGTR